MLTQLSAKQLRRAADLVEVIEKTGRKLATLLSAPAPKAATKPASQPAPKKAKRPRAATNKGVGRPNTVASAVREILAGAGKPLKLDDLIKALAERGRPLGDAKNARKMFSLRLYKMAGVKRVGRGLFAAAAK